MIEVSGMYSLGKIAAICNFKTYQRHILCFLIKKHQRLDCYTLKCESTDFQISVRGHYMQMDLMKFKKKRRNINN